MRRTLLMIYLSMRSNHMSRVSKTNAAIGAGVGSALAVLAPHVISAGDDWLNWLQIIVVILSSIIGAFTKPKQ